MRKITCIISFAIAVLGFSASYGQGGIVTSVAGCSSCSSIVADGAPATSGGFGGITGVGLTGICQDAAGNIYLVEPGPGRIRMVEATSGFIYTIAGTGGSTSDGIPATAALLNGPNSICTDAANNLYVADAGNNRIRKINLATDIISTVAGGGISTADGVAATAESIVNPFAVYVDAAGNIYCSDGNKIRKVSATSGLITTVAGNGTSGDTGDGGPALSAGIAGPVTSITMDASGNIYFTTNNNDRVRKITIATGIINTVAGGGACQADGIPATSAQIAVHSCAVDSTGNVIIADYTTNKVRMIPVSTGKIYTIGGAGYSGGSLSDDVPALSAYMHGYGVYMNKANNILYYTDSADWARKMAYSSSAFLALVRDSFWVNIAKECNGPVITVNTNYFNPGLSVTTWFGDGQYTITPLTLGCVFIGNAVVSHTYACSGTYTIKQVLYDGTSPVDSLIHSYQHTLCNDIRVDIFEDMNGNCIKDSTDPNNYLPITTFVDSNGVLKDSISATSGFYYKAFGANGDVYKFSESSLIGGYNLSCPSSGFINDTLQAIAFNTKTNWFGFSCAASTGFDLSVHSFAVAGIHDAGFWMTVNDIDCATLGATLTLNVSPKYAYEWALPPASSVSGNTITWNITEPSVPQNFIGFYQPGTGLTANDTFHYSAVVTPISGDVNPANNSEFVLDTVNASGDPNGIAVQPQGCITSGDPLQYTIHFENDGTDTAFNINVMDTISGNVDLSTLKIVSTGAVMEILKFSTGSYNIVKFDFPNINLLDSTHHGLCDNMVVFTVNVNNRLPNGDLIFNHAGIYFDYNPVVMTNTVENIANCEAKVGQVSSPNDFQIFPNPAEEQLTIATTPNTYSSLTITNTLCQVLMQQAITTTKMTVNVADLPPGLYYIICNGTYGNKVEKFVKM